MQEIMENQVVTSEQAEQVQDPVIDINEGPEHVDVTLNAELHSEEPIPDSVTHACSCDSDCEGHESVPMKNFQLSEVYHHQLNDNADSIEIGTPAKGGAVKIYCDFNRIDEFKQKIKNAMDVRKFAQEQMKDE